MGGWRIIDDEADGVLKDAARPPVARPQIVVLGEVWKSPTYCKRAIYTAAALLRHMRKKGESTWTPCLVGECRDGICFTDINEEQVQHVRRGEDPLRLIELGF